jgi:hypothetical protein
MRCPKCGVLARLRRKTEVGQGLVNRIYRCQGPSCGYRFTTVEQVAGPTAWGGSRPVKLTAEDVAEIKALLGVKVLSQQEIAKAYGVTQKLISKIALGDMWRAVKPLPFDQLPPRQAALLARERVSRARENAMPVRDLLVALQASGCTLGEMSQALHAEGHRTRTGRPLSQATIRGWLQALELAAICDG